MSAAIFRMSMNFKHAFEIVVVVDDNIFQCDINYCMEQKQEIEKPLRSDVVEDCVRNPCIC